MNALEWEDIDSNHKRAKVIGGWLVKTYEEVCSQIHGPDTRCEFGFEWRISMCFVPDEGYNWG